MRLRSSVAIDLGTVNTLIWVAGRGIVLEEPTAIAIDTAVGQGGRGGRGSRRAGRQGTTGHPGDPPDAGRRHRRPGRRPPPCCTTSCAGPGVGVLRPNALVCVPSGATPVERRSIVAALGVRRPRYNVRLIDEPVAAAAGAGFDLTGGAGGFVVDIGGGTTEVAAVAGWRVVRARSLRKAGNAMDEAIGQAIRNEIGLIISQRAARQLEDDARRDRRRRRAGPRRRPRRRAAHPAHGVRPRRAGGHRAGADRGHDRRRRCTRCCRRSRRAWPRTSCAARSGWPAAGRCCPAWPAGSRPRPASARSWSRTRCGAWSAAPRRSWSARKPARREAQARLAGPDDALSYRQPPRHTRPILMGAFGLKGVFCGYYAQHSSSPKTPGKHLADWNGSDR